MRLAVIRVLELKQIFNSFIYSLGHVGIQIPTEYSNAQWIIFCTKWIILYLLTIHYKIPVKYVLLVTWWARIDYQQKSFGYFHGVIHDTLRFLGFLFIIITVIPAVKYITQNVFKNCLYTFCSMKSNFAPEIREDWNRPSCNCMSSLINILTYLNIAIGALWKTSMHHYKFVLVVQ